MFELNDAQKASVYLSMLRMFDVGPEPVCERTARCAGHAYATAYLADDLPEIYALAEAIDDHVGLSRNTLESGAEPCLDMHHLGQIVGMRMATTAANIAGYFVHEVGGSVVWSDVPIDHAGLFQQVSFADRSFDGFAFTANGEDHDQ